MKAKKVNEHKDAEVAQKLIPQLSSGRHWLHPRWPPPTVSLSKMIRFTFTHPPTKR
ncbi:MAG: hypothetical protein ACE5IO_05520 [Thermoplasmata archaeon]